MKKQWIGAAGVGGVVVVVAAKLLGGAAGYALGHTVGAAVRGGTSIEQALQEAAAEVRKDMPKEVDELTTAIDVTAVGRTLTYSYQVDVNAAEVDIASVEAAMKPTITTQTCDQLGEALDVGATIAYRYVDKAGAGLTIIAVSKADC